VLFASLQFLFQGLIGPICFTSGPSRGGGPAQEEFPMSSGDLFHV
jgi:hypothetical protein